MKTSFKFIRNGQYVDGDLALVLTKTTPADSVKDDDMIVGSVHSVCYLETLYWLDRCGYEGWLSMDQYPYREDAAGAIGESILWLRKFDAILQAKRSVIDALIAAGDAVRTSAFLRSVLA